MNVLTEIIMMILSFIGGILIIGILDDWWDALGVVLLFWSHNLSRHGPESLPVAIYDGIRSLGGCDDG